jgi:hypothetical protein
MIDGRDFKNKDTKRLRQKSNFECSVFSFYFSIPKNVIDLMCILFVFRFFFFSLSHSLSLSRKKKKSQKKKKAKMTE